MSARVALHEGATILGQDGPLVVVGVRPLSIRVQTIHGDVDDVRFEDLEVATGCSTAVLTPWWVHSATGSHTQAGDIQ